MKSAIDWAIKLCLDEGMSLNDAERLSVLFRAVQGDMLRHAAEICRTCDQSQRGSAIRIITEEAERLESTPSQESIR